MLSRFGIKLFTKIHSKFCTPLFTITSGNRQKKKSWKNFSEHSMPSPSIPRSKSTPKISGAPGSPSHSDVLSRRTSWSENSPRTWPKKVGAFIARKTSSSSKKLALTEESLKEFNRLNEILEEKKYFHSSPYYKGLTDSTLAINRQRPPESPNHDGESHTGSLFSSTTKTSFVYRMQEWGSSCFQSRDKDEKIAVSGPWSKGKSSQDFLALTPTLAISSSVSVSSSLSSLRRKATCAAAKRESAAKAAKEPSSEWKKVSYSANTEDITDVTTFNKRKPLRERMLQPPSPPPGPQMPLSQDSQPTPMTIQTPAQAEPPQPPPSTLAQQVQTVPPPQPKVSADLTTRPTQALTAEKLEPPETAVYKPGNERTYIWADKYRPDALQDFLCNRNKALELQAMAESKSCGHFIFEGQPGVGKKTMIWAYLREAFSQENVQAREESKKFILKGEAIGSINVKIKQSSKHVEINISELRGYEKHVIVELIKEKSDKSTDNPLQCHPDNCRAIILYDADKLPTEALLYIKWVLERYKACNKLFLCCSDASKIQPLSSLCTLVQLLPPSNEEIIEVLEFIAEKEGIRVPKELAARIAKSSKNNLRQAIRSFEATWHSNSTLKEDQEITTGWEDGIANIARNVIEEQSPKQLYVIRGKLQNLIEHNVSAEFIFETLVKELKKNLDGQLQKQLVNLFEKYNKNDDSEKPYAPAHRQEEMGKKLHDPVKKAVQQFMRIEEFIAKFMSWYKCMAVKNKE